MVCYEYNHMTIWIVAGWGGAADYMFARWGMQPWERFRSWVIMNHGCTAQHKLVLFVQHQHVGQIMMSHCGVMDNCGI